MWSFACVGAIGEFDIGILELPRRIVGVDFVVGGVNVEKARSKFRSDCDTRRAGHPNNKARVRWIFWGDVVGKRNESDGLCSTRNSIEFLGHILYPQSLKFQRRPNHGGKSVCQLGVLRFPLQLARDWMDG